LKDPLHFYFFLSFAISEVIVLTVYIQLERFASNGPFSILHRWIFDPISSTMGLAMLGLPQDLQRRYQSVLPYVR
jgi:hypothetical protein